MLANVSPVLRGHRFQQLFGMDMAVCQAVCQVRTRTSKVSYQRQRLGHESGTPIEACRHRKMLTKRLWKLVFAGLSTKSIEAREIRGTTGYLIRSRKSERRLVRRPKPTR